MNQNSLTVTNSLIIINVVVYVVGLIAKSPAFFSIPTPDGAPTPVLEIIGSYSWYNCFMEGELWRVVTYQFLHGSTLHIVFNMWALYFFGPTIEMLLGGKKFLAFYLICGIAGALFSSLLGSLGFFGEMQSVLVPASDGTMATVSLWQLVPMVGASAAIYGVMTATAILYPDIYISLIFPPVTMTLRVFAIIVIAIASATVLFNWSNAGGEAGHLGGILMAAAIIWPMRRRLRW